MINQFFIWNNPNSCALSKKNTQVFTRKTDLTSITDLSLTEQQAAFEFVNDELKLHLIFDNKLNHIVFNLSEGELAYRANKVSQSNEVIAKAIGCKSHYRPKVLDTTAGMGRDAFIMALLGCNVVMQERNFAIYLLLNNALERLSHHANFANLSKRLKLTYCDSLSVLDKQHDFDVIYCDPMFPQRKKSALVKKEMRIFKRLSGDDSDANNLLIQSLQKEVKRVVVKRPKGAPFLSDKQPSHQILAKQFRFDIYLQ